MLFVRALHRIALPCRLTAKQHKVSLDGCNHDRLFSSALTRWVGRGGHARIAPLCVVIAREPACAESFAEGGLVPWLLTAIR